MKLPRKKRGETSATRTQTLGLMAGCSALLILTAYASDPTAWNDPAWWSAPGPNGLSAVMPEQVITNAIIGVVTTNYIADNSAAVTQGQLKKFTVRAVDELNSGLSGGAGSDLSSMVSNWAQDYATNGFNATNLKPSDYTAMTVGQLKYIGNKVWSQLVAAGYTNAVPSWLAQNTSTDNALANIGQLKEIFNFSPSVAPPAAPSNLTVTASNPGELDLTWTNNASNATSITINVSTDGGVTWTKVTTLTDPSINSYAVTGLSSGSNYQFQITASNTAGPSPTTTNPSPPSPPVPRYAVIDFGTNFFPVGLNNSNIVVGQIGATDVYPLPGNGSPAIWSWSSNTYQPLPVNSAYQIPASNYCVVGIDDAGHIAGNFGVAWFTIPPSSDPWASGQDVFGELGCYWTNASSTPLAMGQGESSDNGNFPVWESYILGISDQGYMVGNAGYASEGNYSPNHVEQFNPAWTSAVGNEAQVLCPPYPWPATNYPINHTWGLDTNAGVYGAGCAGGATNWCGWGYTFGSLTNGPDCPIINGTMYKAAAYTNIFLQAINDSNIAVGYAFTNANSSFSADIVSPVSGTALAITYLGPGSASYLNNQLATNGTPSPQIIGGDTNGFPMLWDKTTYAATAYTNAATGNYLGKTLSLLLANSTNGSWTMSGISGMNNNSIIGSAYWSPSVGPPNPNLHGVMLIADSIQRDGNIINATNNTVCVGQQINLTNIISGIPTNAITSWKWSIPGANGTTNDTAICDYEPETNPPSACNYTNLVTPTNYLTNSSGIPYCNFYWTAPGTNQVSCTSVIYGQTNTVNATFKVSSPHAMIFATNGTIGGGWDFDYSFFGPYLHFGVPPTNYPPPNPVPGMYFTQTNSPPSGGFTGSFTWVQLLTNVSYVIASPTLTNADSSVTPGSTNPSRVGPGLDNAFPYGFSDIDPVGTSDSPGSPLLATNNYVYENFAATMILMYKPDSESVHGDKTVWVPLRQYGWHWYGAATNATPNSIGSGSSWGLQSAGYPPTNAPDSILTNEPIWTQTITNGPP